MRSTSPTTEPERTTSNPCSSRSWASRSASASARNAARFADIEPLVRIAASSTNSGTTSVAARLAACSTGLSCTRKSRVNNAIATLIRLVCRGWPAMS